MQRAVKYLKFAPFYLLSFIPMIGLEAIAAMLYLFAYHLLSYRRSVVFHNLSIAFPEKEQRERKTLAREFYREFCRLLVFAPKVLTISKKEAMKKLSFRNPDMLKQQYENDKSVIVYGAHLGNWEWFAFYPLRLDHKFVSVYQEQSNSYFNELSLVMRSRFGNVCIKSQQAFKELKRMNDQGMRTLSYFLADQSPHNKSSMTWVPFFGRDTAFLGGAERIAKKLDHALVYPFIHRMEDYRFEIEFIEIDTSLSSEQIIRRYAQLLEENIRLYPKSWLWSHRRWKLDPISKSSQS